MFIFQIRVRGDTRDKFMNEMLPKKGKCPVPQPLMTADAKILFPGAIRRI